MIRTVLFDVDGVLLSEERYFDASALTVWELLGSERFLDCDRSFTTKPTDAQIKGVRADVFVHDRVLKLIKSRGINANWDMVYLSFAHQLIYALQAIAEKVPELVTRVLSGQGGAQTMREVGVAVQGTSFHPDYAGFLRDFEPSKAQKHEMLRELNVIAERVLGRSTTVFGRSSELWELCRDTFQEWYLGDDKYAESVRQAVAVRGKQGFLHDEIPIVEPSRVREMLVRLRESGLTLGIGTGRPHIETMEPLSAIELLDCFDPERVVTASTVLAAEEAFPSHAPLAKPHPYCYLKGLKGIHTPDQEVLRAALPIAQGDAVLVVGDSLADLLAARAMGCQFAATLTGLSGAAARSSFEEHGAEYIFDDVLGVESIFQ